MQLVAYGTQDIYLTGNPQITFFKAVYKRHTNFAVEAIEQTINGTADFGKKFSVTIARNGDLLSRVYLELQYDKCRFTLPHCGSPPIPSTPQTSEPVGFNIINYTELEIGGQIIDKQYGEWMTIWCDLTQTLSKKSVLNRMMFRGQRSGACGGSGYSCDDDGRSYLPLQFWFCRNIGLALPLIALQYHEVKINFDLKAYCDAPCDSGLLCNVSVYADYVFLDTDERRRFAQSSHEYLIEQVQYSNEISVINGSCHNLAELRFNHPVKELMWVISKTDCPLDCNGGEAYWAYSQPSCTGTSDRDWQLGATDPNFVRAKDCLIQLNGHDRFRKRQGDYFTDVQRYEHHTGGFCRRIVGVPKYVHLYSFALKPEKHQPSGSCNFSRIDNAVLVQTLPLQAKSIRIYAINYNVLRIMSGMGGLAYSN